jgi:hypothetical protein
MILAGPSPLTPPHAVCHQPIRVTSIRSKHILAHAGHAVARVTGPTCKTTSFHENPAAHRHALSAMPLLNPSPHRRKPNAVASPPARTDRRCRHRRQLIDSHPALGIRLHHVARFIHCSCPIHSGCGPATSMHHQVQPGCASSLRCQTTAVFRRSSFDRFGCLPTHRNGPGQVIPAPAPHRHVCKHGKLLVGPFVVDLCPAPPVALERHRDCLAALPPRFRVLLLRPRSQTPAFEAPARPAGTGHHPGCQSPSPVRTSLRSIVHVA